ncbi:MAG: phosphotransferase [Deltaproteobacteria bacterium]|nr:phosphotransferase [Deltaproteobacteria bacterium]
MVKIKKKVDLLYNYVESQVLHNQIVELFKNYNLGEVEEIFEVFGGYTNRSFGVICRQGDVRTEHFVRKYKVEATPADVLMEHSLINYAVAHGFQEAADIVLAQDGRSYVEIKELKNEKEVSRIFTVYRYLLGRDKYSWIDNKCTPKEYKNLGALLARFHLSAHDFKPSDQAHKTEPKVEVLLPSLAKTFSERAAQPIQSQFHAYFAFNLPRLLEHIEKNALTDDEYAQLPTCPIHGDYHAGNVKFDGEETVGLFDFDWSKIDVRLFDVSLGMVYCCGSWDMVTDGQLRLDDCRSFLDGYNSTLKGTVFSPLKEIEKNTFVKMLANAHIYLVYWLTELWYYLDPDNINDYEAVSYLTHFLRGLGGVEENASALNWLARSQA